MSIKTGNFNDSLDRAWSNEWGAYKTTTATVRRSSKSNKFSEQNNNSARASHFFVYFFNTLPAQIRREMTKF